MNERENLIRRIRDCLAVYAVRVDMDKGEASRAAEDFYCGLLNLLMGYELQNMNRVKANYPAIDLGDAGAGLGVQVTSTATRKKVQDTLDALFRNGVEEQYPHLVMLVINKWTESRRAFRMDGVCQFDPERDIWDTDWLLRQIDGIPELETLEKIHAFLTKHLHLVREPAPALNLPLRTAVKPGDFVGREAELREIGQRFETERIVAVSGLGGMGKTELAVRFGQEYQDSGRGWAYMLHCGESFGQTLRDHVTQIIPGYRMEGRTEAQITDDALAALNQCGREDLLILDNADEVSMTALRRELSALRMRVLVTTRKDTADALVLKRLPDDALYAIFRRHKAALTEPEMDELIAAVDGHTITVDLMARLLRRERRTDTLGRLKQALSGHDLASPEFGKTDAAYRSSPEQARINEHLKAVFRVAELTDTEKNLLRFATLLGEGGLDSQMFERAAESAWKPAEPRKRCWFSFLRRKAEPRAVPKFRDVLQELADKGWLLWAENDIRIHPIIRIVCIEVLKPDDENCEDFLFGLRKQYDPMVYDHKKYRQLAEVFTEAAGTLADPDGFWASWAGFFWYELSELQRALSCNLQSVEEMERHQPGTNNLATGYNNVGSTYDDLGDYQKALEYILKALEIRERVLPEDHPDLAMSYNNGGSIYGNLGDHQKALEYKVKALEIQERVLPEDHPDLAMSYNNIGVTYGNLGNHQRALEYKLKALEIGTRVLPGEHPDLAQSYNNVGSTYDELGDHQKALEYKLKALEIREQVLPEDHPDLAQSYNNVGSTYDALGDQQKALEYHLKALKIRKRVLPEDHPDLALSYNNVGSAYGALGDQWKALEYKRKALEIRERVLPEDHPDLAQSYNNVGCTYGELGDHQKALEYNLKALEIRERVLPEDHPDLAQSYNNVGYSYGKLGDQQRELEYYLKALAILERVQPGNHPDLALSCSNIAWTYYELGQLGQAAAHMRRAAEIINASALPERHPHRVNYNKWADFLEEEAGRGSPETT